MVREAINKADFFRRLDEAYQRPSHLMARKMRLVESLVRPGWRLLDIGCGTGEAISRLKGDFECTVGLDASAVALEYARRKVRTGNCPHFLQGSVFRLCFPSRAFDCCLLLDVLEHLERPDQALEEVARVSREDGQLVVTVPNWTNLVTARLLGLNPEHRSVHTPKGWKRLIEHSGFRVRFYRAVRLPFLKADAWARRLPYAGMCIMLVAERCNKA